uniref:Ribosomal protein S4 n=1 Tax=Protohalopteris sp. TaxID=2843287 RepID=A0A8F0K175_9PHAE|nr:ribosomal protein S4 [Protohalopteris sp.]
MKFKSRYKSCLWARKDVWGNLLKKKHTFLRVKWDRMMAILSSQRRRRRGKPCKDYGIVKPSSRSNQVYNYVRWGFRNSLGNRLCARRFYGDVSHKSFRKLCKVDSVRELAQVLESRLDINLCRLEFFSSIYCSRQAILHGKILVNNKKVTFGHFLLKFGDIVEFCPSFRPFMHDYLVYRSKFRYRSDRLIRLSSRWVLCDYSNLFFIINGSIKPFLFYPYRFELDELISFANYGY